MHDIGDSIGDGGMTMRTYWSLSLAMLGMLACVFLKACSPAEAQGAPGAAPALVEVKMTHAQIEANLNLVNEAVKALGLSQPQRVQDALGLLALFQSSLKADADARAKAPVAAAPNPDPPKKE